jgi:hypothetical protein
LCYKLMSSDLLCHVKIIYVATKRCWSWYTEQVREVKTPQDNLKLVLAASQGRWAQDGHLGDTLRDTLSSPANLSYMGIEEGDTVLAERALMLAWHIVAHRAWSLAARYERPPECYAGLLSGDRVRAEAAALQMQHSWAALMSLEQRRLHSASAQRLWNDIDFATSAPTRLLHIFFEREQYRVCCLRGLRLLRGMLEVLPDNKIVEDVHNCIRRDGKGASNDMRGPLRLQHVVMRSGVLEQRGVPHTAAVTKSSFVNKFKSTRAPERASNHQSRKHKLPVAWTGIMQQKVWKTVSEVSARKGVAAWRWALSIYQAPPAAVCAASPALFSKLIPAQVLLQDCSTDRVWASFGNATWAVLVWPVEVLCVDSAGLASYALRYDGAATFLHVTNPENWRLVPFHGVRESHGIIMKQTGPSVLAVRAALEKQRWLSHGDLVMLVKHYKLELSGRASAEELRRALLLHVTGGDEEFVSRVCAEREPARTEGVALLVSDPLFEAAYEEMGDEDKLEFPTVKEAIKVKRVRRHVLDWSRNRQKQRAAKRRRVEPRAVGVEEPHPAVGPPQLPSASSTGAPEAALAASQGGEGQEIMRETPLSREPRADLWGRERFALAPHFSRGVFKAWSVTCRLHRADGTRCNKSLAMGGRFTSDEALHRIKQWCVDGLSIPDTSGGRDAHRFSDPRSYLDAELSSIEELEVLSTA